MAQQNLVNKPLTSLAIPLAIGFWSAVIITFFNVASSFLMIPSWFLNPITPWHGIEAYASTFDFFQIASMLPGFFVVIPFLPMMAAIHYSSPPERRILSILGIAFAGIYVAMLGFQYYSQFTVVRYNLISGEHQGLGLFVLGNPYSFFWPLEVLGYGFMSLSTLFVGFVFSIGVLERWIRGLFITNGVIGIAGILAYPLGISTIAFLSGLALWTFVFPASTILLAINFKRKMKTGVETVQTNTSYA